MDSASLITTVKFSKSSFRYVNNKKKMGFSLCLDVQEFLLRGEEDMCLFDSLKVTRVKSRCGIRSRTSFRVGNILSTHWRVALCHHFFVLKA